jgi:hypothetical protein
MFDFLRRDEPALAAVHFPGSAPPPAEAFARLRAAGYELHEQRVERALWSLALEHPVHGSAELTGFRDGPLIDEVIRFAPRISEAERAPAMGSSSVVGVRVPARRRHVLADRKTLLRIARDVLGDDGVMVVDVMPQVPWSRAGLDDELMHDADLDIEALYSIDRVVDDPPTALVEPDVLWLHTHGLAELGAFDIDIVAPDRAFADSCGDLFRTLATMVLDREIRPSEDRFTFGYPDGVARLVPADKFMRQADRRFAAVRDGDDHANRRSILCEPSGRRFLGLGRRDRPEPLLSARRPPAEQFVLYFPNAMSTLMAERARATIGVLRALMAEFAEFEVQALVKLGYPTSNGGSEHLWFTVHAIGDETVDATLENEPFEVDLRPGERAERPLDLLSDWILGTPAGPITPRSMEAARSLREHAQGLPEG